MQGSHGVRGAIGEYHAPRSGGRIHEGFDVTAACGTPLVAVRNGKVLRSGCHLHFEIRVSGVPIDPEPSLRHWDRYS